MTFRRYSDKGKFRVHYDWLPGTERSLSQAGNRLTSFFVYIFHNCTGGTTVFPEIPRPRSQKWCRHLKCRDESGAEIEWLEVKPKVGTAIFWYNLLPSGEVDMKTLHAGAMVLNGTKFGLNIWTRQRSWRRRS